MPNHKVMHDEAVAFFRYVENFLKPTAPKEQIMEELTRMVLAVVYAPPENEGK